MRMTHRFTQSDEYEIRNNLEVPLRRFLYLKPNKIKTIGYKLDWTSDDNI